MKKGTKLGLDIPCEGQRMLASSPRNNPTFPAALRGISLSYQNAGRATVDEKPDETSSFCCKSCDRLPRCCALISYDVCRAIYPSHWNCSQ
jgi:hypothetical protein